MNEPVSGTGLADISPLVQAIEAADSKAAIVVAVRNLAAVNDPAAIPMLIKVLGYNNPGAAVAAVDGLVTLGSTAVPALLKELDGYNYGARAWAIRALALIGDPRALPVLLETALGDFALSVRRAAARGIGTINWSHLPKEQVPQAQAQVLQVLHQTTTDPEWVVRYAAVAGLHTLALNAVEVSAIATIRQQLHQVLTHDPTPAVQARAQMALNRLADTLDEA
jgi:phycocyanobilin lyase beta subunit